MHESNKSECEWAPCVYPVNNELKKWRLVGMHALHVRMTDSIALPSFTETTTTTKKKPTNNRS